MSLVNWLTAAGGISGVVLVARLLRRPYRAVRSTIHKSRRITAALVGEEAINDPDTGRELRPAVPGIVDRLASIESESKATRSAIERLADVHDDIAKAQKTADDAKELAQAAMSRIDHYHGVEPAEA